MFVTLSHFAKLIKLGLSFKECRGYSGMMEQKWHSPDKY